MTNKCIDFIADTVNYVKHLDCYEKKITIQILLI